MYYWIVFAGTMAFALSGVMAGRVARPDIVGGLVLAIVTGLGGGAVRDVCLGLPVSTIRDPWLVSGIFATAVLGMLAFGAVHRFGQRILLIADGIGLGIFNASGFLLAVDQGLPVVSAIMLGAVSACGGGMIRDVLCRRTPFVMVTGEMYLSACLAGTLLGLPLLYTGQHATVMLVGISLATSGLRFMSIYFGWVLPTYPLCERK